MNLIEKILSDVGLVTSKTSKKTSKPKADNKTKINSVIPDEEMDIDKNDSSIDDSDLPDDEFNTEEEQELDSEDQIENDEEDNVDDQEVLDVKSKDSKKNERSHKPKSKSYGISKEAVAFLKEKGLTGLNVYPQSFVTLDQIQLNPEIESKGKDSVWVAKFPVKLPNGQDAYKTAYTRGFMKKNQVAKYKKISKITSKDILKLEENTTKLLASQEKSISDAACILKIILKTGLRIGSVDNSSTGNLGVRTLKKENISITGDTINLKFIGKSYQENVAAIKDKELAVYLKKSLADKKPKDNAFVSSYEQVGNVMKKINPKGINPKDLRTYKATEVAKNLLQDKSLGIPPPLPKDGKDIKKLVKDKLAKVFTKVAEILNNTPAMARNSYVHPIVITDFLNSLGLAPKEVGYKHITMEAIKPSATQFTTMDQMLANYSGYGNNVDFSDISEEDMYECEEYPVFDWLYNPNVQLMRK